MRPNNNFNFPPGQIAYYVMLVDVACVFMAPQYDPRDKFPFTHNSLNILWVCHTATKNASIVQMPLCKAAFTNTY